MTTNTKTAKSCAAAFRRPQYTHTPNRQRSTCELLKDWHCSMRASDRPGLFPCMAGPPGRPPTCLAAPGARARELGQEYGFPRRGHHTICILPSWMPREMNPPWRCRPALDEPLALSSTVHFSSRSATRTNLGRRSLFNLSVSPPSP